jgi:hypothetical protein
MSRILDVKRVSWIVAVMLTVMSSSSQVVLSANTIDVRVKKILDKYEMDYEVDTDGDFKVKVKMKDGRTQTVWVFSKTTRTKERNIETRSVYSASDVTGGSSYALFSATVGADISADNLVRTITSIGVSADLMEQQLTGQDKR